MPRDLFMQIDNKLARREILMASAATLGSAALIAANTAIVNAAVTTAAADGGQAAGRVLRIGVISANIRGKSQPRNGHTWHFTQYLHPTIDLDVYSKLVDPGSAEFI